MAKEKLIGRTVTNCIETSSGLILELDNGEKVVISVSLNGGPGADSNWYQWGVLRLDDQIIARV